MPKLIALSSRIYGRRIKKGDSFSATAQEARLLIALGKAKADFTPPQTLSYRTTDLVAETTSVSAVEPVISERTGRPRRQYRRRDMSAEK